MPAVVQEYCLACGYWIALCLAQSLCHLFAPQVNKEEIRKTGYEIQAFPINVTYSLKEVPPFEEFDTIPFQRLEIFAEIMYPFTQFLEDLWQVESVFGQKSKDLNFL